MIKIENVEVFGWEHAIRGMRNPMNSWEKSDSWYQKCSETHCQECANSGGEGVCLFDIMHLIIESLNKNRKNFIEATEQKSSHAKKYWWQMIQLLPSSYNQKRTVMLNYEVLVGIYKWRKEHKLDEWREFCKWIEQLPYSEIITGMDLTVLNKDFVIPKEENENDK